MYERAYGCEMRYFRGEPQANRCRRWLQREFRLKTFPHSRSVFTQRSGFNYKVKSSINPAAWTSGKVIESPSMTRGNLGEQSKLFLKLLTREDCGKLFPHKSFETSQSFTRPMRIYRAPQLYGSGAACCKQDWRKDQGGGGRREMRKDSAWLQLLVKPANPPRTQSIVSLVRLSLF